MIANAVIIAMCAIVVWQGYETAMAYRRAEGTRWERIKIAFRESATIAWARLNALSAVAVAIIATASEWLGAPGIKEAIEPYLGPGYMLAYLLLITIGAEVARRRTLES